MTSLRNGRDLVPTSEEARRAAERSTADAEAGQREAETRLRDAERRIAELEALVKGASENDGGVNGSGRR